MPYKFTLPSLDYSYDALEPYIDAQTMQIHYEKHHQAYIDELNKALEPYPSLHQKSVQDLLMSLSKLPEAIQTTVRNNGGGHINHTLFWKWMKPQGGGEPRGEIGKAIKQKFESFSSFQALFSLAAKKQFGSGWAWLVINHAGDLEVISTANQDSPLLNNIMPLLGIDVWEHAYYLKYHNKRVDYIAAWWNTINWAIIEEFYRQQA